MSRNLSESAIIRAFAKQICQRLTGKIIASLQKMNDGLQSGERSGLQNIWDEICVQIQYEESILWGIYDQTVRQLVETEVEKLLPHEREAMWLQTTEADRWDCKDESERESYPVFNDAIVSYLVKEHIYHKAGRWSNERIREYLDREGLSD